MTTTPSNSNGSMTNYVDLSGERQSGGIKRRGDPILGHEAKRLKWIQEEHTLISLPTEVLVAIIQKAHLVELRGLLLSCKKFNALVFTHTDEINLNKGKQLLCLQSILNQLFKNSCHNLTALKTWVPYETKLRGSFNDETLDSLIRFPHLTCLSLGRNNVAKFSPEVFLRLTALQKLVHLELDFCELDSSVITPMFSSLSHLQVLRLRGITLGENDRLISSLATTSLQRLAIWAGEGQIQDSEFSFLPRQTDLQVLILFTCENQNLDNYQYLTQLRRLNHLGLFSDEISNQQVEIVKVMSHLTSLHLGKCNGVDDGCASSLIQLKKLNNLALTYIPHLSGEFFRQISSMNLISLRLAECHSMQDEDLEILRSLTSLQRLDIDGANTLGNNALMSIAKFPWLSELRLLSIPNIDDEGIKVIVNMDNLKYLDIRKCQKISSSGIHFIYNNHINYWRKDLKVNYNPCS